MLLALAGDEADLLAPVAVGDRDAADRLDDPPLGLEQHHAGGDDPARVQPAPRVAQVLGQDEQRMGMAEEQPRAHALPVGQEALERRLVDAHRVEVDDAVLERGAQAVLQRARDRRVAPDGGHRLPQAPAGPFVRAQGGGGAPLDAGLVAVDLQRDPRGAAGLRPAQVRLVVARGHQRVLVAADVVLGQDGQARQVADRADGGRVDAGRAPRVPVVRAGRRGVRDDAAQGGVLPGADDIRGIPLRAAQRAQGPQAGAALVEVPRGLEDAADQGIGHPHRAAFAVMRSRPSGSDTMRFHMRTTKKSRRIASR